MKTAVAETSVAAFYEKVVPKLASSQNERVMSAITELDRDCPGIDFSLSELVELVPGIDKSACLGWSTACVRRVAWNQLQTESAK